MQKDAYFFEEGLNRDFAASLDLELLVCGRALEVDTLPAFHPFRSDPFFRIYFADAGGLKIAWLNGVMHCKRGNLYLIPAKTPFQYLPAEESFTHRWVHFHSALLESQPQFGQPLEIQGNKQLSKIMDALLADAQHSSELKSLLSADIHLRMLLLPFLGNRILQENIMANTKRFSAVLQYLDHHYSGRISLRELAAMSHLSPQRFSSEFQRSFGIGIKQYLVQKRITEAQRLLLTTKYGIKEIAHEVGYDNEYFFYRIFRKYTGSTPADFRKKSYLGY